MKHSLKVYAGILTAFIACQTFTQRVSASQTADEIQALQRDIQAKQEELDGLKEKLKKHSSKKDELQKKEKAVRIELNEFRARLSELEKDLSSIEERKKNLEHALSSAALDLVSSESEYLRWVSILKGDLNFIARNSWKRKLFEPVPFSPWIHSYYDSAKKEKILQRLLIYRLLVLKNQRDSLQKIAVDRDMLAQQIDELSYKQAIVMVMKDNEKKRTDKQKTVLDFIRKKRTEEEKNIKALEESARLMQTIIDGWAKKKMEAMSRSDFNRAFVQLRGSMPWPLEGTVAEKFGKVQHPYLPTYRIRNGILIQGEENAVVSAVYEGQVVYAAPFKGYGNTVIIDHQEQYYTVYGYLARVDVKDGQWVRAGEHIGSVSARRNPEQAMLYFEFRENGMPVDPLMWLAGEKVAAVRQIQ